MKKSNFIKFSDEQVLNWNYLRCTYRLLPVNKTDFEKIRIPFACAVTPFPKDMPEPPLLPLEFINWSICSKCHAVAAGKYIICPNRDENYNLCYLCSVCNTKNAFDNDHPNIEDYPQSKELAIDAYYPESADMVAKYKREPSIIQKRHLLIIEHSDGTIANGVFSSIIEKLKETVKLLDSGWFSVFVYNKTLLYPMISKDHKSFKIMTYCDLDGAIFPSIKSLVFNLKHSKDLFLSYLDYLQTLPASPPTIKMYDLIRVTHLLVDKNRFSTVIVTSQAPIGEPEDYKDLGLELIRGSSSIDFVCISPHQFVPNYSALNEYIIFTNGKLCVKSQSQSHLIPQEVLKHLFTTRRFEPVVYAAIPEGIKLLDIQGCGLRRTAHGFALTSISPGDTIYFYFTYSSNRLELTSPSLQFQCKYLDPLGQCHVRVISCQFNFVNNMSTLYEAVDFDAYAATCLTNGISKAREFEQTEDIRQHLDYSTIRDKFSILFFLNQESETRTKVKNVVEYGRKLLNKEEILHIFGRNPIDIVSYTSPRGYHFTFNLNTESINQPVYITGFRLDSGALYIKLDDKRAVIYLAKQENYVAWAKAVNQPPINDFIATICQENSVELLHHSISESNPLYQHITKILELHPK